MMKKVLLAFFLILFSCAGIVDISPQMHTSTNYAKMVYSIEKEDGKSYTYFYLDGDIKEVKSPETIKLYYRKVNETNRQEIMGSYNSGRFSFILPLTKGIYLIDILVKDENGNLYIEKDISVEVE